MRTIWKYELKIKDEQVIDVPFNAIPLFVAEQDGSLCLWAEVDTEKSKTSRFISIAGTGHPVNDLTRYYVGSALMKNGLVWHVYMS